MAVIPATGSHFVLDAFEAWVQNDPEILGALYTGSLGRGTADRYSDLDIELWVTDRAFQQAPEVIRRMMDHLGHVHFMYQRGRAFATGFVGPDWQRVDIELHRQTEMQPQRTYAHARVIKDVDGQLAHAVARSPRESVRGSYEQARGAIEEAIDSQLYLCRHNARGAIWSATGEVSHRCAELYMLLARLRGHDSFGFRYVEQILSSSESELLRRAWPRRPEREEVRRAAGALWRWTRYVWQEAEATIGRPLDIQIDEAALLAAIDLVYSSSVETNRGPDAPIETVS